MRATIAFALVALLQGSRLSAPPPLTADASDGDPVSLSTGLYWRTDDDLSVAGTRLALARTYRTRDDGQRPFGIGVSHSYHLYLVGDGQTFQWADLILADGGRIHFRRIVSGRTASEAIFEHTESPTEFYGSLLQWNGGGWNIDLRNGTRYMFGSCTPGGKDLCRLLGTRDARGNEVQLQYDDAGDLQRVTQGESGWIAFAYDAAHRIITARASDGETMTYRYDARGRLASATRSDGRLQEYTYGKRHEVLSIREPDRAIVNTYDEALRCIKQVITFGGRDEPPRPEPDVYLFGYTQNAQGKITRTRTVQPSGTVRITTYNANGYLVTDTTDPGGPRFVEVVYARDDRTNLSPRVTVRCAVGGQIVEAFGVVGEFEHPDEVRGQIIRRTCR